MTIESNIKQLANFDLTVFIASYNLGERLPLQNMFYEIVQLSLPTTNIVCYEMWIKYSFNMRLVNYFPSPPLRAHLYCWQMSITHIILFPQTRPTNSTLLLRCFLKNHPERAPLIFSISRLTGGKLKDRESFIKTYNDCLYY